MSKFMYRVGGYRNLIEKREIIRETSQFVVIPWYGDKTNREKKRSDYQNWFDSWTEAYEFLKGKAQAKVISYQRGLEEAKKKLDEIESLSPDK